MLTGGEAEHDIANGDDTCAKGNDIMQFFFGLSTTFACSEFNVKEIKETFNVHVFKHVDQRRICHQALFR